MMSYRVQSFRNVKGATVMVIETQVELAELVEVEPNCWALRLKDWEADGDGG